MTIDEAEIIRAARRGVEDAYRLLFTQYAAVVYLFLLLRLDGDNRLAEELTERTCVRVFSDLPRRRPRLAIGRLLYAVASQTSADAVCRSESRGFGRACQLPQDTLHFLRFVRALPDNYQLPTLASFIIPERQRQAARFSGVSDEDFALMKERGENLCRRYPGGPLSAKLADSLLLPGTTADRFLDNWRILAVPTALGVLEAFVTKFACGLGAVAALLYLFLAVRLSSEVLRGISPLFLGIVLPTLAMVLALKLAKDIDRRDARQNWCRRHKRENRDGAH